MFKCEWCNRQTESREKQHKKIIKSRPKQYSDGGTGWEIAEEVNVCGDCVDD